MWEAIGAILGGIFGQVGKHQEYVRQRRAQKDTRYLSGLVADAERAGLHPLAALGVNVPSMIPGDGSDGQMFGQGLGNLAGAVIDRKKIQESENRQNRLIESQIAENQARAKAYEAQASRDATKSFTDFIGDSLNNSLKNRISQLTNSRQDAGKSIPIHDTQNPEVSRKEDYLFMYNDRDRFDIVESPFGSLFHRRSLGQAENFEQLYGEIADYIYPFAFVQDMATTLKLHGEMDKPKVRRNLDTLRDMRESLKTKRSIREVYIK